MSAQSKLIQSSASDSQITAVESPWKNRNFVLLFLSGTMITLGGKVYELALPLILYEFTHSEVAMTTMRAIEFLPNLLLAMFIGVWVDRSNKKRWTQMTNLLQFGILLGLYFMLDAGYRELWLMYIAGFFLMTLNYSFGNGRISMVKQVLPRNLLTSANANYSAVSTLIAIMGPAITGYILLFSDLHDGLLITAAAFAVSFGIVAFLPKEKTPSKQGRKSFWHDFRDGWHELRNNRPLWMIAWLVVFLNSAAGIYDALTIYFAKDTLHLDNSTLGLVLTASGIGGLIGSRLVALLRKKLGTGRLLGLTIAMMVVAALVLFFADNAVWMAVSFFISGLFGLMQSVCIWTFRQESTPAHMIGRVSGITGSMFKLGMPFAIFGSGFVAQSFNPSVVFLSAAVLYMGILVVYRFLPLWRLR